jgi:copper(I)-binding protein
MQSSEGMMAIREIDHIDIPTGTSMALTPGETITIRLILASGQSTQVQAPCVANPVALDESTREGPKSHED